MAWNRPVDTGGQKSGRQSPSSRRRAVLLVPLVLLVLCGLAIWWWFGGEETCRPAQDDGEEVRTSPVRTRTPKVAKHVTSMPGGAKTGDSPLPKDQVAATNGAETAKTETEPTVKKRVFKTHTDQLLAMLASVEPGVPGPPLPIPDNFDEMFLEQCKQPIEINDDDSEEVKLIKQKVWDARQEIAQVMKEENKTFKEIIDGHQEAVRYNYKIWKDADKELRAIYEKGDIEGAKKFHKGMNEAFRQLGILELDMPGQ